jgi:hypothetical protein
MTREPYELSQQEMIKLLTSEKAKKEFIIEYDDTTIISFTQKEWEILNRELCIEQQFNNNDVIDIEASEEQEATNSPAQILQASFQALRQRRNYPQGYVKIWVEEDDKREGITYYSCENFSIGGFQSVFQIQEELLRLSQESKRAKYYIKEAYKDFHASEKNTTSTSELLPKEKKEKDHALKTSAFRQVGILTLAKIYDTDKMAVSLFSVLKSIKKNFHEWAKIPEYNLELTAFDEIQIQQDLDRLCREKSDLPIKKLFRQRDKSIAHLDRDYLFENFSFTLYKTINKESSSFPNELELETLINFVDELIKKYLQLINLPLNES